MLKLIDRFLNSITMYRLTLYYLIVLVAWAVVASALNLLPYDALDILLSVCIALTVGYCANFVFAKIFGAVTNVESVYITILILVLIVPVKLPLNFMFVAGAAGLAMASKYLLTVEKRHIFNPAAISVAYISLLSAEHAATWWVGTPVMLPVVLVGGLLLMRKIRREKMIVVFLVVYLGTIICASYLNTQTLEGVLNSLSISLTRTALFFLAFVMLTEPMTAPATEPMQLLYAAIVAILNATPQLKLGIVFTPELALSIGNIFSHFVNPGYRFILPLQSIKQLTSDTVEFTFDAVKNFHFIPGQYMEWTLPHAHSDNRGVRRYFSLASSPTEATPKLLVKFYDPPSSYKRTMLAMKPQSVIVASQLSGDFTLPKDTDTPLALVAGGVGVAPFRSMVKYIIDKKIKVDIVHLFINKTNEDIIYKELFDEAEKYGVRTVYFVTSKQGHLATESIKATIPDFMNRKFYISGPQLMVQSIEQTLLQSGASTSQLKTDFFPGYFETTT